MSWKPPVLNEKAFLAEAYRDANLSTMREPQQVRQCFALTGNEAKEVGQRCYICDRRADHYVEAGETPHRSREVHWKYTMFLCGACIRTHSVDVKMWEAELATPVDSEATPEMFRPADDDLRSWPI